MSCQAETLRLRGDSWMPYNGDPAAPVPGYAVEIARTICERNHITLDYQTMPWGDALKAAADGQIEAVVGANKDEAAGLVLPGLSIGAPRVALVVKKGNPWRYENLNSLRTIRLGVVADYKYWAAIDEYIAKAAEPQVRRFAGEHPLVEALATLHKDDLDAIVETSTVLVWTAKSAGYPSGTFHIVYLHQGDPVYFVFASKGDDGPRYARLFDDGLRELRKSGDLARILARYDLTDWQE